MLDRLYDNIENVFNFISKALIIIGIALGVIGFIYNLIFAIQLSNGILVLYAFLTLVFVPIVGYLLSLIFFALAKMLHNQEVIIRMLNNKDVKADTKEIKIEDFKIDDTNIENQTSTIELNEDKNITPKINLNKSVNDKLAKLNLNEFPDVSSVKINLEKKAKDNISISLNSSFHVEPDENGYVICPKCHKKQRKDRETCYNCGVKFKYDD